MRTKDIWATNLLSILGEQRATGRVDVGGYEKVKIKCGPLLENQVTKGHWKDTQAQDQFRLLK